MCHRSGLPRTVLHKAALLTPSGLSRTSWTARALAVAAALLFYGSHASAQPGASRPAEAAGTSSAVELAAGACRLERWAAAVDLMRVVERQARGAEDWLCLARAQLHTGQWVAALDSYDELVESETPSAEEGAPTKERSSKLALAKTALAKTALAKTALAKTALATDRLAQHVEARQLGAIERQELEEQLGWLEIVPSSALPVSVKLSLDGEPIARSRIGVAFPVQPGPHAFAVEVRGVVRELEHWRIEQGERRRVHLSLPAERPAQQAVAPLRPVRGQPQLQSPRSGLASWARGALYAGGISTSIGVALLAAGSTRGQVSDGVVRTGLGSFLLGGMSLLTGAGLYLAEAIVGSRPSEAPPEASQRPVLQPWVSSNSAGVSGSF